MAMYSDVTRESVMAAVRECDSKGRDRFLADYGYGRSRSYFLIADGREYDSKAILLAACRYEHRGIKPLPHDAFRGGKATVVPFLRSLEFEVRESAPRA